MGGREDSPAYNGGDKNIPALDERNNQFCLSQIRERATKPFPVKKEVDKPASCAVLTRGDKHAARAFPVKKRS